MEVSLRLPIFSEVLKVAYIHFKLLLATEHAFPDSVKLMLYAREAWDAALDELEVIEDWVPTSQERSLIPRAPQLRGLFKNAALQLVPTQYGLRVGSSKTAVDSNRALVALLLEKQVFMHVDYREPTTLCQNPIAADILSRIWFRTAKDIGVRY
ncbi:hypothetical protein OBBRIDRAFT_853346 [Obba rivulosa]|uniref:DUF6532 domain-containing protein n=1 Tax=Obba rivulosa TaxID=1052685 RepID=A0A8E2AQT6_9APHY|nr:hypothetical protein OBBRIDRAFT_853346 [Obba rivulosa]